MLDKIIDKIFSMKKKTVYLSVIFLIGFIWRLIGAINFSVAADDMHHVTAAINFFASGKLITYDQSSGLWHAFTSVVYGAFGTTQITSRFAALLFGSFSILLLYLLSKEFFNEKVSLTSAFLLAISPFSIKSTMAEMDVMAMFFALFSMLFFIRALKHNKNLFYGLSGLFMGLAIYTKIYPILFVPSLLIYFIYVNKKNKKEVLSKSNIKKLAIFAVLVFLFAFPTLTHNYLLYKDKGFLDLIFTKFTGVGKEISAQYYSWDSFFTQSDPWSDLIFGNKKYMPDGRPLLIGTINYLRIYDPSVFYLGLMGIFLIYFYKKENRNYLVFFLLGIAFLLPFLTSSNLLSKHYLFLFLLLIPIAALSIIEIDKYFSKKFNRKIIFFILGLIFIFSLIFLGFPANSAPFYGESHIGKMIEFKDSEIPKNSLIVMDSRIYRGRINWVSQGRPYLEAAEFLFLTNQQDKIAGETVPIEIFYFECIKDDCGWGTIKDQPEFNQSMESLTDFFKKNGKLTVTLNEPDVDKSYFPFITKKKIDVVNVYKMQILLKAEILQIANQPKDWFLYPIGYTPIEKNFDYYETHNLFDSLINKFAHFVVLIALCLAFLSPVYLIYLLWKK